MFGILRGLDVALTTGLVGMAPDSVAHTWDVYWRCAATWGLIAQLSPVYPLVDTNRLLCI